MTHSKSRKVNKDIFLALWDFYFWINIKRSHTRSHTWLMKCKTLDLMFSKIRFLFSSVLAFLLPLFASQTSSMQWKAILIFYVYICRNNLWKHKSWEEKSKNIFYLNLLTPTFQFVWTVYLFPSSFASILFFLFWILKCNIDCSCQLYTACNATRKETLCAHNFSMVLIVFMAFKMCIDNSFIFSRFVLNNCT